MELSVPVDFNLVNTAKKEFECLYSAAHNLVCYQTINGILEGLPVGSEQGEFWRHCRHSTLGGFVYNWCKLYGMDSKEGFWKQVTLEQKTFRERIYQRGECDYPGWTGFRQQMTELRNELMAHFSAFHSIRTLPDFRIGWASLTVSHEWLRELMSYYQVEMSGPISDPDYFDSIQAHANAAVKNLV